jgi:phage baseplate assembly protein W
MSGTNSISEVAISLPFTITPYGNVATTTDQGKIWADRVVAVLGTGIEERVLYPNYGSRLHQELYDGTITPVTDLITKHIEDSFVKFLPLLQLLEVVSDYNTSDNTMTVTVKYELPNKATNLVKVGTISLNGDQISTESI